MSLRAPGRALAAAVPRAPGRRLLSALRRTPGRALLAAVPLAALLVLPSAAGATVSTFEGACRFAGPISPKTPITLVPTPGAHFSYNGTGVCSGKRDGAPASNAPVTVVFTNVATTFDTCELGPDFNLRGRLTIGVRPHRDQYGITINLARLALAGPFVLTTTGGGRALGTAMFNPQDPAAAPQQCASSGVRAATLDGSFNTTSPLIGVPEPSTRGQPRQCVVARHGVLHLRAARGEQIVRVDVYVDGRRVTHRQGRRLRTVVLPSLFKGVHHTLRIVTRSDRGITRVSVRRYNGCAPVGPWRFDKRAAPRPKHAGPRPTDR